MDIDRHAGNPVEPHARGGTGRLLLTWLPTSLGGAMLVVEIPLVYAAVARSAEGAGALATLGVCLGVLMVVNTPALALTPLVVAEAGRDLRRYVVLVGVAGTAVLLALGALPPLARGVSAVAGGGYVVGVPAALVAIAPNSLGVALRRYLHGRLIAIGRTRPIVVATGVRVLGSAGLAFAGVAAFGSAGAVIGAAALSVAAFIEASVLALAVRHLPAVAGRRPGVVRRHVHLSAARLVVMAPFAITMVGVAHGAHAAVALVVWPALYELIMLFAAPTSDWESVTAAASRRPGQDPAPRRATGWLVLGFTVALGCTLFGGPGRAYLAGLLAVPREATQLGLRWAPLLLPIPALWLLRGYRRGMLIAAGRTARVATASVAHLVALTGCLLLLAPTGIPGIASAGVAMSLAIVVEIAVTIPYRRPRRTADDLDARPSQPPVGDRDRTAPAGPGRPIGRPWP